MAEPKHAKGVKAQPRGLSVEETLRQRKEKRAFDEFAERFKAVGLVPDELVVDTATNADDPRLGYLALWGADALKVLAVFEAVGKLLPVMVRTDMDCLRVVDELREAFTGEESEIVKRLGKKGDS